jgi:four helix bundle protein
MAKAGHEQLRVYQLAHTLSVQIHAMTLTLPKFELYEEGSQIRRSSKRVAASIVEGYALRNYKAEFRNYLLRAYGSSVETLTRIIHET